MDFHVEPGFIHRSFEPRFFVRALDEGDTTYCRGNRWQIQFLNEVGEGAANVDFGPHDPDHHFDLLAVEVPASVVQAARRGVNDYVDAEGNRWDPIHLRRL